MAGGQGTQGTKVSCEGSDACARGCLGGLTRMRSAINGGFVFIGIRPREGKSYGMHDGKRWRSLMALGLTHFHGINSDRNG
jgi:hypothetical protein